MINIEIRGHSMTPILQSGDSIQIDCDKEPQVGDLILFKDKGELVVHRYLPNHKVKGDNAKFFDGTLGHDLEMLGVAEKRFCSPTLAFLSQFNTYNGLMAKPIRLMILIIGYFKK